jgi:iron complex transport system substrate-binding protein
VPLTPRPTTGPTATARAAVLSRRAVLAAGTALLLGACGSGATGSAAPAAPGTGAGAFPRSVRHELGETEVASAPARVVAATDGAELASLLALGVRPVGFGQREDPMQPWTAEGLAALGGDVETYDLSGGETSFEQLAAWAPDLVVVQEGFATEDNLARFAGVAPTVATSFIDWRASLRQVADALGRPEDGERLISESDSATAAARTRLTAAAGRRLAMVVSFATGEDYVLNAASPVGKLAPQLGLAPFPRGGPRGRPSTRCRPSSSASGSPTPTGSPSWCSRRGTTRWPACLARPLVAAVPAVAAGRIGALSIPESNAAYFDSVLTVPRNVALLERLAGA